MLWECKKGIPYNVKIAFFFWQFPNFRIFYKHFPLSDPAAEPKADGCCCWRTSWEEKFDQTRILSPSWATWLYPTYATKYNWHQGCQACTVSRNDDEPEGNNYSKECVRKMACDGKGGLYFIAFTRQLQIGRWIIKGPIYSSVSQQWLGVGAEIALFCND